MLWGINLHNLSKTILYISICESTQIYPSIYQSIKVIQTIKSVYPNKHLFQTPVKIPSLPVDAFYIFNRSLIVRDSASLFSPRIHTLCQHLPVTATDHCWKVSLLTLLTVTWAIISGITFKSKSGLLYRITSLFQRHFLRDV